MHLLPILRILGVLLMAFSLSMLPPIASISRLHMVSPRPLPN